MKLHILIAFALTLIPVTESQSRPLLGAKVSMLNTPFCKKYKCVAMPRDNGGGYILSLPGDQPLEQVRKLSSSKGLNIVQLWARHRTTMIFEQDERGQLVSVEFDLREHFFRNTAIYFSEAQMLIDFMDQAVSRKVKRFVKLGQIYSPEIEECFYNVRFDSQNNDSDDNRVMFTGNVLMEVQKKTMAYDVNCSFTFSNSINGEKVYSPHFIINTKKPN
jgi:hypothetical protein